MKKQALLPRLIHYAGKYKVTMFISWLFSALGAVISIGPYICIFFIARELLATSGDLSALNSAAMVHYGWLAVNLTIGAFGFYGLGLICSHITAFHLVANLRIRMVRHLGELPLGFHIVHPSGKLRKTIEKNAENTENFVAHQMPDTVQAFVMPLAFLASMIYFDWRLALVCLIPIALGFYMLVVMLKGESSGFLKEYQASLGDMSNAAVEYVRGISVVKVFGQTIHSFRRFYDAIYAYKTFVLKYALSMEKPMSGYIACVHGVFFVLIPAGILFYQTAAAVEAFLLSFIFFIVFTPMISVILMRIMYGSSNAMIAGQALDSIEELLEAAPMPVALSPQAPAAYDIVFDSVSFRYGEGGENALENLSFTARAGTVTALVGPSGGGKSTVANLIARFWDVDGGSIRVGGVDLREMDTEAWLRQVSFVFQDVQMLKMSIADNVAFSRPGATREEIAAALQAAQCDDILDKLPQGMDTVIGEKGVYLSGGEMQRLALARAILKDAPVVLLDEATAFADPENEFKIQKALDVLMQGKTVIMIAHRLSTVVNADQILLLKNGSLLERGSHGDLLAKEGLYAAMFAEYRRGAAWKIGGAAHA